jgi:hypothetical protein
MGHQMFMRKCSFARRYVAVSWAWFRSLALLWLCTAAGAAQGATFVQVNAATPQNSLTSASVAYSKAQTAGNTNILAIGWNDATSSITSVKDTLGNTYRLAVATARGSALSQAIYYASNIKAAAAGANTVTVTLSAAAFAIDLRITEYSGLDPTSPFDVGRSAAGNTALASSGTVTTTAAGELIFGAGMTVGGFSAAGTSLTSRIITWPDYDIAEDRSVTTTGNYGATAPLFGAAAWLMQVASFKNKAVATGFDVVTHHYDVQRTGWNSTETVLTAANVNSSTFGLIRSVAVDDQIDAQPLVLTNQPISGVTGNRTVVYLVTANNTVYAIDAATGAVLLQKNFGTPVSQSAFGNCNNNGSHIGIHSTPVADRASGRLYLITYTADAAGPTYRLHALNLSTLADVVAPVVITASHSLVDGSTYAFHPGQNRQRTALLEANGNIYAGFATFCDFFADISRGWVLGWNATTLAPLVGNQLIDRLATGGYYLSEVWMSGAGIAASATGDLFFSTGNTGPNTYNSTNNIAESVVRLSADLTKVLDFFTPAIANVMDANDEEIGGGGVLLVPTQSGPTPSMAVALGKWGVMFLLNQQNLGHYTPGGPDNVLGSYNMDQCWCTHSYFMGSDGVGRVVTSAGSHAILWKIQTSPTAALVEERTLPNLTTGQDAGFFTTVSSNGTKAGTAVVWAVSRPVDQNPANVTLYAFNPTTGAQIFSAAAGTWPAPGNANIVPVVANGQVYVASTKQLAIFGPKAAGAIVASAAPASSSSALSQAPVHGNQVTGRVFRISGSEVIVQQSSGAKVTIDAKPAEDAHQSVLILKGEIITAEGELDALGVLHAKTIVRAKASPALWPTDQ